MYRLKLVHRKGESTKKPPKTTKKQPKTTKKPPKTTKKPLQKQHSTGKYLLGSIALSLLGWTLGSFSGGEMSLREEEEEEPRCGISERNC